MYNGPISSAYDPTKRSEVLTELQVAEALLAHRYCTIPLGDGAPCDDRLELILMPSIPHLRCNTHRWVRWGESSPISDRG